MRVKVSRSLYVLPGDDVHIYARLPVSLDFARLYVFARQMGELFSPYMLNAGMLAAGDVNGKPVMGSPLALRLTNASPHRMLRFTADIRGYVQVMQEIDLPLEPVAKVKIARNPDLFWYQRWIQSVQRLFM